MAGYSVVEVGPLGSWSDLAGVAPGKSFVEGDLGAEFVGISVNSTEPGGASPFWHSHAKIEEIYVFIEGNGELALDDEVIAVGPGTIVRVGPDVWRALRCLPDSSVPLKWLCIRGGEGTLASVGNDADLDSEHPLSLGLACRVDIFPERASELLTDHVRPHPQTRSIGDVDG